MRRFQRTMARFPIPRHHALDEQVTTEDGRHIPIRVFKPKEKRREEVLLFFHGGWVTGDIESYTPACATMADLTGCVVTSVDYRLAPEHPFPAGLDDCVHVTRLMLDEPQRLGADDPERIVIVGDSAGGNLAAVVSQHMRDHGLRQATRQILLYPVTHWDHDPGTSPFASVRELGDDLRLTNTEMREYLDLYVPDPELRRDPRVAPLMATDFSRQPDTLLITAALDLLRDEGEAYGRALADAGNRVRIHRVDRALHGFIGLPRFSRALRDAYEVINEFLDGALPPGPGH